MNQFKILLLNCTAKSEPSEVEFLTQLFKMMKLRFPKTVNFEAKEIRRKEDFKKQICRNWPTVIHISAHGHSKRYHSGSRGKETSIQLVRGHITAKEVSNLPKTSTKLVFLSACLSSYEDMANAFIKHGAQWYLAPKTEIHWVHAALFAVMFYRRYIWDRKEFVSAYKYARKYTRLGKDFPEYWFEL